MKKKSNKGTFRRTFGLFASIRIPWHLYILEAILGIISAKVSLMYIPYLSEMKLGNIQESGVVSSYIVLMLAMLLFQIVARIPAFYARSMVARNLQNKLIHRSLRLPMRALEEDASEIVSWITQDCTYADGLITALTGFITGLASVYMSVTTMSVIDMTMVALVPAILVYILFSTWLEGRLLFRRQRIGKAAAAELTAFFSEHMGFFHQVRQLHAEKEEYTRGKKAIDQYFRVQLKQELITIFNNIVSGSLSTVINIFVFVLGVPLVRQGKIAMTDLVAFQNYVLVAYNSLSSLPGLYTNLMYYNGELFYIAGLMDTKEEVYTRKRGMDIPDEDLHFDNVSFAYGETPVLRGVSFTIPKGKVTMLTGPNGSGKTTVFKLIQRFYTPDSGKMTFGAIDAEDIHLNEWRQSITYVLQDPQLFNGTIRENITYGIERKVTDEEVISAAKMACADEFIRQFPEGYDFNIGDNGCKLSAGQRQRLAIARALMLDPAYLLLDEATCNMDVYSEKSVTDSLLQLMKGRTTVMISHDMDMLHLADHVIVLNEGNVEACGSRDETVRSSALLRELIAAEKKGSVYL